jgi:hypothetical protein
MDCPGEGQRHGMTSPAAGSTAARAAGQRGVPTGAPSGCWARRALGRARGRCARPSPAWARRRRGDGAGTQLVQGAAVRRGTACMGVRTRVKLLKPERGIGIATGRRGGVTAEPGSTPWAAASTEPAVGQRVRDWVHGMAFKVTQKRGVLPLATVRALPMATATRSPCARRRARLAR